MTFATDRCLEAESFMQADVTILQCASDLARPVAWPVGLHTARSWLKNCEVVIEQIRFRIVSQTVQWVQVLAAKIEKHTPRYDHFINETKFVPNLAKKHLLAGNKEKELLAECVDLFKAIAQVAEVAKKYNMASPKDDPKFRDALEHGEAVFEGGKKAATVITTCRVALVYKDQEQSDEAAKILAKWRAVLPGALVSELSSLCATAKGVKRKPGEAKLE